MTYPSPFTFPQRPTNKMSYVKEINVKLKPATKRGPLVLDLFAGCGGLALGFESQGFETFGFEMDEDCCKTYEDNLKGKCSHVFLTPETEFPKGPVIIGGPPCQPFSVGGKQLGRKDSRDGFPVFLAAIEKVNPEIWMFENVRGLFYRNRWYLDEVISKCRKLGYIVEEPVLMKAVQYGVPQNRERVVVIGHKGEFQHPTPFSNKINAGEALEDLAFHAPADGKYLNPNQDTYIAKYEKASCCKVPRDLHLDRPSRTVTCRNLAGATGDMMRVLLPDGRRRRLTPREGARLQSFPDWFEFSGGESSQYNQVGNAVPPMLSYWLADSIRKYLDSDFRYTRDEIFRINQSIRLDLSEEGKEKNVSNS